MTPEEIAFMLLTVYISESEGQHEGIEAIMHWRKMAKTEAASQKVEQEPRVSDSVWVAVILLTNSGEIWSKPVRLQVGLVHTMGMHDEVLS